ncbi:unnamed protein product [Adineta steineri]|uniref:Carbohydrate sulfotransferase n=1 Tax=Adineta steineri TaxID=433720 RepID=A0A815ERZ7_9BILA|nr:unnamed protein product [Adineta steineri]
MSLLSLFLSHLTMTTNKSNSTQLDLWSMYQKTALPYVRPRTLSDSSILFSKSFTRIIFVRHPFERLASAYVDKIATLSSEPFSIYDNLRRKICRKFPFFYLTSSEQNYYRTFRMVQNQRNEPCDKVIPTFEHFVTHIMFDSSQVDVHWQPYSTLCHACTMKYNFIGKYETIQEDLDLLRVQLGLNTTNWNTKNNFSTGKTKENYKLLYSKLPNHLICNLKHFYQEDFKLFNYQVEDYLIDNQKVQCSSQSLLRVQLGLNTTNWNTKNNFSTGKTKENYKLLYSKLPNHLICNLKHFYQEDFKLFNYQVEDYLIDNQKVQCSSQSYRRFSL